MKGSAGEHAGRGYVRVADRRHHGGGQACPGAGCRGGPRDARGPVTGQHVPAVLQHEPGRGRARSPAGLPRARCRARGAAGLAGRQAGRRRRLRAVREARRGGGRVRCPRRHARPRYRQLAARAPGLAGAAARPGGVHRGDAGGELGDAPGIRRRRPTRQAADRRGHSRADLPAAQRRRHLPARPLPGGRGQPGKPGGRGEPAPAAAAAVGRRGGREPPPRHRGPGHPAQHRH